MASSWEVAQDSTGRYYRRPWRVGRGQAAQETVPEVAQGGPLSGPLSPDGFRSTYDERATERRKLAARLEHERLAAEELQAQRAAEHQAARARLRGAHASAYGSEAAASDRTEAYEGAAQVAMRRGEAGPRDDEAVQSTPTLTRELSRESSALLDQLLAETA